MQDLTHYLPGIFLAYTAFLLAIASPGPNILAVIGTSMGMGRQSGISLALGVASGSFTMGASDCVWIIGYLGNLCVCTLVDKNIWRCIFAMACIQIF